MTTLSKDTSQKEDTLEEELSSLFKGLLDLLELTQDNGRIKKTKDLIEVALHRVRLFPTLQKSLNSRISIIREQRTMINELQATVASNVLLLSQAKELTQLTPLEKLLLSGCAAERN